MENIKVYVRIRPSNSTEKIFALPSPDKANQLLNKKTKEYFPFDHVITSETTEEFFNVHIKKNLINLFNGVNMTFFAYGQTSTGKTFTMMGKNKDGIIPLCIKYLFSSINSQEFSEIDITASYIEIYNETINDLLDHTKKNLELRESTKGVCVVGLTEETVNNYNSVMSLISKGENNRVIAETKLNQNSSRSHSVFRISIKVTRKDNKKTYTSQLNLIDLAGSENASKTQCVGIRLKEGSNINKSLLALSNVVSALNLKQFVNYRNSKLTRLLQNALGGNSKTSIICTITDDLEHYSESMNTIHFGTKARGVKTYVRVNEIKEIKEREQEKERENEKLRNQVKELKEFISANRSYIKSSNRKPERTDEIRLIGTLEKELANLRSIVMNEQGENQEANLTNPPLEEIKQNVENDYSDCLSVKRNLMLSSRKPNFKNEFNCSSPTGDGRRTDEENVLLKRKNEELKKRCVEVEEELQKSRDKNEFINRKHSMLKLENSKLKQEIIQYKKELHNLRVLKLSNSNGKENSQSNFLLKKRKIN